ncbi:MAG: PIN domain-containing protein [Opitutales bacterium]
MSVLVDTSVWSLALRRTLPTATVATELARLVHLDEALLIGPIRQEVLSGYSDQARFQKLLSKLAPFPNQRVEDEDYLTAAEFSNRARASGIQGSHIDFLICAVAARLAVAIFSTDKDFEQFATVLPIKLHR